MDIPAYLGVLFGGVLGLVVGVLAAVLRERVDRRVRGLRDVERVTRVPVVGAIVADRRIPAMLTARAGSRSPSADSFRSLRAYLDALRVRDGHRAFVLTGAEKGHGATTVAANVAIAIANTGATVVVVDADLRRPELSSLFDIRGARGLSDVLAGRIELDAVLRGVGIPGLTVLPSGAPPVNAGELLASARTKTLLAELAERFEVVIVDTPAISSSSDAAVLGALTGSTLLVVAQGGITRSRLDDALGLLEAGGSDPIGIVLNRTRRPLAIRSPALPTAGVPSTLGVSPRAPLAAGKPATPAEPGRAPAHLAAALPAAPSVESPAPESPAAADAVELPSVVVAAPAAEIAPPAEPAMVERPIVVRPDPPRPVSRFAPDPTRFGQRLTGAYANAPAPTPPAEASEEPQVTGTVVNTVSVAVQREVAGAATVPPPIRHILPRPAQKAVEGPPPTQRAAPLKRQPVFLPSQLPLPVDDTRAVPPKAGSLLREIGGLRGVEVRTARPTADDGAPDAEREARESYEQRARQLEHVAHERLMREQERLAAGIREQLAHDKRELASVLDNRLEDTVLRPIPLPVRRVPVRRSGVPAETPGDAR